MATARFTAGTIVVEEEVIRTDIPDWHRAGEVMDVRRSSCTSITILTQLTGALYLFHHPKHRRLLNTSISVHCRIYGFCISWT